MIYLDYAANAPADPAVLARFCELEQAFPGNPNSTHPAGQAARAQMEACTASIAQLLGAQPQEVIYTSGATESNNLALKGMARAARHVGRHIISTPLEHSSVGGSLTALQQQGYEIDLLDIRRDGTIDLAQLAELLRPDTVLVALCAVDSELGTIQPLAQAAEQIRRFPNCRLHVDATQAIGRIPVDFSLFDTMSLAPHKLGGLNGSGLLLKKTRVPLEPLLSGGASTTVYRSGTPALALAGSTELALRLALEEMPRRCAAVAELRRWLQAELTQYPAVRINSPANAVPHILNLSVQGVRGVRFQQALAAQGVCVSVKSACTADGAPSKAVFAVSRDRKNALSSWRISLSHGTTRAELEEFMQCFDRCYHELVG